MGEPKWRSTICAPDFDGADLRVGIIQARFNEWAGGALFEACVAELEALGVDEDDITHLTVPGALEIPVALASWRPVRTSMR